MSEQRIDLKPCCKERATHESYGNGVFLEYDSMHGIHWADYNPSDAVYAYTIHFCPWCGEKLVNLLDCDPALIPDLDLTDWRS